MKSVVRTVLWSRSIWSLLLSREPMFERARTLPGDAIAGLAAGSVAAAPAQGISGAAGRDPVTTRDPFSPVQQRVSKPSAG
jgi:hypothetical protein